jgi:hypothetical protein
MGFAYIDGKIRRTYQFEQTKRRNRGRGQVSMSHPVSVTTNCIMLFVVAAITAVNLLIPEAVAQDGSYPRVLPMCSIDLLFSGKGLEGPPLRGGFTSIACHGCPLVTASRALSPGTPTVKKSNACAEHDALHVASIIQTGL